MSQAGNKAMSSRSQGAESVPNSPKNNSKEFSNALINHQGFKLNEKDENSKKFQCEICFKPFAHEYNATGHVYTHMSWNELEETEIFHEDCEFCGKIFLNGKSYMRHLKTHTPPSTPEQSDEEEAIAKKSQAHPKEFIQIEVPPLPRTFQNDEVDVPAQNSAEGQNSPKFAHEQSENDDPNSPDDISPPPPNGQTESPPPPDVDQNDEKNSCKGILKQFQNSPEILEPEPELEKIIAQEPTSGQKSPQNVSKNVCYFCNKKFKRADRCREHFASHTKETPFKCSHCSQQFSTYAARQRHGKQCDGAIKKFVRSSLARHDGKINHEDKVHMNVKNVKQIGGSIKSITLQSDRRHYSCYFCYKTFSHPSFRIRHLATHTKEAPFKCQKCKVDFRRKFALKRHEKSHGANGGRIFQCSFCPLKFTRKERRILHERRFHFKSHFEPKLPKRYKINFQKSSRKLITIKQSRLTRNSKFTENNNTLNRSVVTDKNFKCGDCGWIFETGKELKLHQNWKVCPDKKILVIKCIKAKTQSATASDSKVELKDKPSQEEINSVTPAKEQLKIMTQKHSTRKQFLCYFCTKNFPALCKFYRHLTTHTKETPFHCLSCKKEFALIEHLKRHEKIHRADGGRKISCRFCHRKFAQNSNRIIHERIHLKTSVGRAEKHPCYFCGMKCFNSARLNRHLTTHTQETPYTCSQCQKQFKSAYHLKRHLKAHTKDKNSRITDKSLRRTKVTPFKCFTCKKAFTQKPNLRRHEKLHRADGGRIFPCSYCSSRFTRKELRIAHEKKVHLSNKDFKNPDTDKTNTNGTPIATSSADFIQVGESENSNPYSKKATIPSHYEIEGEFYRNGIPKSPKIRKNSNSCYFCLKNFPYSGKLNRHLVSHTKEAPFKCSVCKKEFSRLDNLKTHEKIHGADEGRIFPCSLCSSQFTRRESKISHEKKFHSNSKDFKKNLGIGGSNTQNNNDTDSISADRHLNNEISRIRISTEKLIPLTNLSDKVADESERNKPKPQKSPPIQIKSLGCAKMKSKHQNNKSACYFCGKCVSQMDIHLLTHIKEMPLQCAEDFNQNGSLTKHEKTHRGVRNLLSLNPSWFSSRQKNLNHVYNDWKKIEFIPTHETSPLPPMPEQSIVIEIGSFGPRKSTAQSENTSDETVIPTTSIPECKSPETVAQSFTKESETTKNSFMKQCRIS